MPEVITAPPPTFATATTVATNTATTTTAPVLASPAHPQIAPIIGFDFLVWLGMGLAVVAVVILLVVLVRLRSSPHPEFGFTDLRSVLKRAPDAVALVIDSVTRNIYWLPLFYQGGYYTSRLKNMTVTFTPIRHEVYRCGGKPCYVVLRYHETAFEYDPLLASKFLLMSTQSDSVKRIIEMPMLPGIKELINLSTEISRRSGDKDVASEVLVDASPFPLLLSLIEYLSEGSSAAVKSVKSIVETAIETGGQIERVSRPVFEFMRYVPYLAIALAIVVLVLAVAKMF